MHARHTTTGLLAAWLIALPATAPARDLTLALGTTVVAGDYPRVVPAPGLAASVLFERRWLGVEAGTGFAPLARCHFGEALQTCGSVWMFHTTVRATLAPAGRWSPFLAGRLDLVDAERNAFGLQYHEITDTVLVPAVGPRVGLRYRGARAGFFVEAGPSFMPSGLYDACLDCGPGRPTWWVFQASAGFTWSWVL